MIFVRIVQRYSVFRILKQENSSTNFHPVYRARVSHTYSNNSSCNYDGHRPE